MKNGLAATTLAILMLPVLAAAQAPAAPAQGRGGPPPGVAAANAPQQLDQITAKRIAEAAQAAATAAGATVAIAVIDANTDLVHFIRMDGVASRAVEASQGKARATILFGVPTRLLGESVGNGQPISVRVTPTATQNIPIWTVQGGLPILRDGKIIGAIGVGGSTSPQDEKFAQAGIDSLQTR
jgi:glc operon protein GlcG